MEISKSKIATQIKEEEEKEVDFVKNIQRLAIKILFP